MLVLPALSSVNKPCRSRSHLHAMQLLSVPALLLVTKPWRSKSRSLLHAAQLLLAMLLVTRPWRSRSRTPLHAAQLLPALLSLTKPWISRNRIRRKCPLHAAQLLPALLSLIKPWRSKSRSRRRCPLHALQLHKVTTTQNQPPPSGTGTSNVAANDASTMVNPEKMFQPSCCLEALCQDSSMRGCWFKCVVLRRREKDNKVRVRYQDLSNFEDKGQLKEWIKVARITEPDHLGIRLTERPMLRPQLPTCYRKIESPIAVGVIVDAWLNGGWWEGIVLQQDNVGDVLVYLQGEGRLVELKVDSLRKSFEWREEQWIPLDARKDVADKITLYLKKQKGIRQSAMKKDGGSSSKQKAQKMGEKSSQTVAAAALTAAELAAPSPGLLQPREESDDETANSTLPRKRFLDQGYSFKEKTLEERAKKSKGPTDEAATPITEEGDGMSHSDSSPDAKRCRVDPTNFDGPNGAKPKGKARKSSRAKKMGSLEGSIHGGTSGSASTRCAASVNTVPMEDICITSGAAPIVAMDKSEVIDLTMYG
uniref:Agenet domain-containing protein n=1 Tax=Aegilops tauschii subsp. strangulata TaxID=200361 RepID=A0A453AL56_AEGTS